MSQETLHNCTTTSIEGTVKEAPLPTTKNKLYLLEKADYAVRFPKLSVKQSGEGKSVGIELKQVVMSGLIRADEYLFDYLWYYKAEVCFDMSRLPPTPFLSTSDTRKGTTPDPNRRHTLNPFPMGLTKGLLRRPDVIIVKNKAVRWPGQAGPDHHGTMHPDNLERVVEVKFPGDKLFPEQREAYLSIAGSRNRFSVLEVHDCRDDGERQRDRHYNAQHKPAASSNPLLRPTDSRQVPVYSPQPITRPAEVQGWTQQAREKIEWLLENSGLRRLSKQAQQHLHQAAIWLGVEEKGKWVRSKAGDAWEWVSTTTGKVLRYTDEQLRAIWREVQHYTDLTLEMLGRIDWVQVLIFIGQLAATVIVVFLIGGALVTLGLPAAVVAGLLVLVRLAQLSWAWLASILGVGAAAGALASS